MRADIRADRIRIECDEDGFHMIVDTADEGLFDFNVHAVAPELFEQVKRIIGSWLSEGEAVRRSAASAVFACGPEDVDESAGLADLHSVHADIWDVRDKWDVSAKKQGGHCV